MALFDERAEQVLQEIHRAETVALLQALIREPSVNPPGDVRGAVAICADKLNGVGFSCQTLQSDELAPNLVARFHSDSGPVLMLNAHLDVVPAGDPVAWTHEPFSAAITNNRVYGRGALDDKASVAAQIMAGVALARSGVPVRGSLVIVEVADEEIGGEKGSKLVLTESGIEPDFVIVGEPTNNTICIGERGGGLILIETIGKMAHGALPWEGANAIEAMAEIIASLRRELWPRLATRTHPYFASSSASINRIFGGLQDNVVPDRCVVSIDRRFVPGEDPEASLAEIQEIANAGASAVPGSRVEVTFGSEASRSSIIPPDSPLVQAMLASCRYLGLAEHLDGFDMATDGRFFAGAGYPTIIFGPGDPNFAHVPDESIGIDELMEATQAYALAALALIG